MNVGAGIRSVWIQSEYILCSLLLVMGCLSCDILHPVLENYSYGQDEPLKTDNESLVELQKLNKEFGEYAELRKDFSMRYEAIRKSLSESEQEFNSIRNQLQLKQNQLDWNAMAMASMMPPPVSTGGTEAEKQMAILQLQMAQAARSRLMWDNFSRSQEMQQLSVSQQNVIRKRLQAMTDWERLQREYAEWQTQWPSFFERYWPFSDPERVNLDSNNRELLAELNRCNSENGHAMIVLGLLQSRMGQGEEAIKSLEKIAEGDGTLYPIASAAKGLVYVRAKSEKKGRVELRKGANRAGSNVYVQWIKSTAEWELDEFANARRDAEKLFPVAELELMAKRQTALIIATTPKAKKGDLLKGVQYAKSASEFNSGEDWYSELVYAIALYAAGDKDEALVKLDGAKKFAVADQLERCERIEKQMNDEKLIEREHCVP